jgi:peptidoglycan/xylan/chitin deacetylase (PgdA/CDA1 family)
VSLKRKVLIGVILALLLCTTFVVQIREQKSALTCRTVWGKAKLSHTNNCFITLDSAGEPTLIQLSAPHHTGSFSNSNYIIKITGTDLTSITGLEVRFYSKEKKIGTYSLPIFAESTLNILRDQLETSLSINWSSLNNKSEALKSLEVDDIQLYLIAAKTAKPHLNILGTEWVGKPKMGRVSLTFDDGYQEHFLAGQILAKNGLAGTAYIITDALNSPNYLTTENVQALKNWGWELGSHLVTPVTELTKSEVERQVNNTITHLKSIGSDGGEKHFAFPLGQYNPRDLKIIAPHLSSARLASGGPESLPPKEIFRLRTVNVTPDISPEKLIALANEAVNNGDWVIFMFHYLDKPEKGSLSYSLDDFTKMAKGLSGIKSNIKTIGDVLKEHNSPL